MERTKYQTLEPELAFASDLAKKAGDAILALRANAGASSLLKSDESSVTAADLVADAVLREGLAATGNAIVTEETWKDGDIGKHPRAWFVDPIDSTENFIKKTREYVVQIGLCVHGTPRSASSTSPRPASCGAESSPTVAASVSAGGAVTTLAGAPLSYEGSDTHADGVCMWTPAARDVLSSRVDEAVRCCRGRMFDY